MTASPSIATSEAPLEPVIEIGSLEDARLGDVLAVRATGFAPFAWLIWAKTNGPWNHLALPVGLGQVIEAVPPRVRLNAITKYRHSHWVLFRPEPPLSYDQELLLRRFLDSKIGQPYDWRAILSFSILANNRDWNNDAHWFCSELARGAFEAAGEKPVKRKPMGRTPPEDFVEWHRLHLAACRWPRKLEEWLE